MGFDDAEAGRVKAPPRMFAAEYHFGYEWQQAYYFPSIDEFARWDWNAARRRQEAVKAKWLPELSA